MANNSNNRVDLSGDWSHTQLMALMLMVLCSYSEKIDDEESFSLQYRCSINI
jgi:hypothetical protein